MVGCPSPSPHVVDRHVLGSARSNQPDAPVDVMSKRCTRRRAGRFGRSPGSGWTCPAWQGVCLEPSAMAS
jgi:hypothetical protein